MFYNMYPEFDRLCLANLSWSNKMKILRTDNPDEKDYYIEEAADHNWSGDF